jgi:hypothetical protein
MHRNAEEMQHHPKCSSVLYIGVEYMHIAKCIPVLGAATMLH